MTNCCLMLLNWNDHLMPKNLYRFLWMFLMFKSTDKCFRVSLNPYKYFLKHFFHTQSWPIAFFHLWASMFTLSRDLLCSRTVTQLSPSSSSTALCPYVMKFAAQESHPDKAASIEEKNPNPPRIHQQHVWGDCLHRQAPRIQAKYSCQRNKWKT